MGRKSTHNLPPGIQLDQHGVYWATLEGDDAKLWRERYPGRSVPRRKALDLKAALKLQRVLTDDLRANRDPNANNPKIADWVQTCIDRKRKLAPSTTARYRQSLKWQIEPHRMGRLRIRQAQRSHVDEWIDALLTQKHQRDEDRTLDPYSIRNAFALLRMAFNMAIADGLIVVNPCKGVELPRPDDEEIHPLTAQQVNILLKSLETYVLGKASGARRPHRLLALYHLAIRCGLRQGELFGLRWKDIDLERRELRVAGQIRQGQRARGKTKHAHRAIPLSAESVRVLKWHKQNQAEEKAISAEGWNAGDLVFCSERGTPLDPSSIGDQFDTMLRKAELPDIRFHDMRHTYAALSIAAGVDIYTLSRRMGHSSIAVTADRYGHLYQGNTQDVDALDRRRYISYNAAALAELPRIEQFEIKPWTLAQAQTFLTSLNGHPRRALYTLALMLGLREGEVLGLRIASLNLKEGTITIDATLQFQDGRLVRESVKTSASNRTLHLPKSLLPLLKEHIEQQQALFPDNPYLFCSRKGNPISPYHLYEQFTRLVAKAGLPKIRFHDLRHSCATLLIATNTHPRTIMEILGHSQISTTMNIYGHVLTETQKQAIIGLDSLLSGESFCAECCKNVVSVRAFFLIVI